MPRPLRLGALALATILLAAGCDSSRRDPGPELLDEVDVQPEISIEIGADGFDPAALTVEEGEAFEVTNVDEEPHGFVIADPYLDTGLLLPGERTVVVLTTPGTAQASDPTNPAATIVIEVTPER